MSTAARFLVLLSLLSGLRLSTMSLYSPNAFPEPTYTNIPDYGQVVEIGEGVIDVSIESSVLRNVIVALPLTTDDIEIGDTVLLKVMDSGTVVYATNILEHRAYRGDRVKGTYRPPAPTNVRVYISQDAFPVLAWEWGGSTAEFIHFSHYDVDARLPGEDWGYELYPVPETTTMHMSRLPTQPLQVRVRAVNRSGMYSAWVVAGDILIDTIAPMAPFGFTATINYSAATAFFFWAGPTQEDVPDLAGYYLYRANEANPDTSAIEKIASIATGSTSITIDLEWGSTYFYNLTAYDAVGNESEYAEIEWMEVGLPRYQLFTNADFEISDGEGGAEDWKINVGGTGSSLVLGDYGFAPGTTGWLATVAPITGSLRLDWPPSMAEAAEIGLVGVPGGTYLFSYYIKPLDDTVDHWVMQQFGSSIMMFQTDGVTAYGAYEYITPLDGMWEDAGDGWYRFWFPVKWDADMVSYPDHIYMWIWFGIGNDWASDGDQAQFDKFQLEYGGTYPMPFSTESTTESEYDSAIVSVGDLGVISANLTVDKDGLLTSGLTPKADGYYDIGTPTLRWKDVYVSGLVDGVDVASHASRHEAGGADEITIEGAAHASTHITGGSDQIDGDQLDIDWNPSYYTPSTVPSQVTSIDHLTAHLYGIDQRLAAIEAQPKLDTFYTTGSASVTWEWDVTVCSMSVTVPTGCQIMIWGSSMTNMDQNNSSITMKLWDGVTNRDFTQWDSGDNYVAVSGCLRLTRTGTYTVYMRGRMSGSYNFGTMYGTLMALVVEQT